VLIYIKITIEGRTYEKNPNVKIIAQKAKTRTEWVKKEQKVGKNQVTFCDVMNDALIICGHSRYIIPSTTHWCPQNSSISIQIMLWQISQFNLCFKKNKKRKIQNER